VAALVWAKTQTAYPGLWLVSSSQCFFERAGLSLPTGRIFALAFEFLSWQLLYFSQLISLPLHSPTPKSAGLPVFKTVQLTVSASARAKLNPGQALFWTVP